MGKRAGAEAVGRLPQCAVGGVSDEAVDQEPSALLEGPHCVVEFGVEVVERHVPPGR